MNKELSVTIVLKEDLDYRNVGVFLGKQIASILCKNEELIELHKSIDLKNKVYSYSNFYEKTEDGMFRKGDPHSFRIRSSKEGILEKLKEAFANAKMDEMVYFINSEYVDLRTEGKYFKAVTPVVLMRQEGSKEKYFANNIDLDEYKKRLEENTLKSYRKQVLQSEEPFEHSFLEEVKITTKKPVGIRYKNSTILGHKLSLTFKEDELSQKIKLFCMQNGMGEKTTSIGSGFLEQDGQKNAKKGGRKK